MGRALYLGLVLLLSTAHAAEPPSDPTADKYLDLEAPKSDVAIEWVRRHNEKTLSRLQGDPAYPGIERDIRAIVTAEDRLPDPVLLGDYVYNFWQGKWEGHTFVRGVWRRVLKERFTSGDIPWDIVIDFDDLASVERENWVFKGVDCVAPKYRRCLIQLSKGGKDAVVVREFDTVLKKFVEENAFNVAESISRFTWVDENSVLIGSNFGEGSLTASGLPRTLRLWHRRESLDHAQTVLEIDPNDLRVWPTAFFRPANEGTVVLARRDRTFQSSEHWLIDPYTGNKTLLKIPDDARLVEVFQGHGIVWLRSAWSHTEGTFPEGSLVSVPLAPGTGAVPELIYAPDRESALTQIVGGHNALFLVILHHVRAKLLECRLDNWHRWTTTPVLIPKSGTLSISNVNSRKGTLLVWFQDFLRPQTLFQIEEKPDSTAIRRRMILSAPKRFDGAPMKVSQFKAASADGTSIPYFVVRRRDLPADGTNPTLIRAYGGFEYPLTPEYNGVIGKAWLERGGAYVVANVRGGGEFGPAWHTAAVRENRKKTHEDLIAVAEDLIRRKFTSSEHLGIRGGSNGGLTVGSAFVKRPDLFNAVVSDVPILDMLRFTLLGRGAAWKSEYGDPADPVMREVLLEYSPYQNIREGVKYPEIFFTTSTIDDRVTPAHARKMTAKLESFDDPVLFYENMEGGHGAAANLDQTVLRESLVFTFLKQRLWPNSTPLSYSAR